MSSLLATPILVVHAKLISNLQLNRKNADHYLKPVVTNLAISRCCDTKKPVGTFRCLCGMIASQVL
ncbi:MULTISPECIES: TnsD family Tn7-like transposition protein [unclassified Microcoleus]|uniref:TnsD family Tn7-like transposition protein n=1 Tax=unclassified Microcoleus TaxID=2642155 RepID=UPI00403F5661